MSIENKLKIAIIGSQDEMLKNKSADLYRDLWDQITDWMDQDGIDYMSEKDSIRAITSTDGQTILCYKGNPYCTWGKVEISQGFDLGMNVVVRAETFLTKIPKGHMMGLGNDIPELLKAIEAQNKNVGNYKDKLKSE